MEIFVIDLFHILYMHCMSICVCVCVCVCVCIHMYVLCIWVSLAAQMVKILPAMWET